ncbi:hypothetical protein GCM10010840_27620 [Deinococcus aerolatus]|uniref:Uncharacterized protein n=1 Tax=Deinococcus aerolatus TaxID=522487 RepID=A0ABQ2GDU0_9DEIO|nr:hypothetical protein [Deinococcus aerolatus]GGL88063.1 hypothetical protein GCM10010840_27620 [Deinococcus aerolatus]
MKHLLLLAPLLSGVTSAQGAAPPPITMVGDVSLSRSELTIPGMAPQVTVSAAASFFKGSTALTASLSQDVCSVVKDEDGLPQAPAAASGTPVPLDAGTPLALRTAQAPYAQLVRSGPPQYTYRSAVPALPAPPAGLVLNIPGAAGGFPAFSGVAVPVSDPLRLTAPAAGESFTLKTAFTWSNPTKDPNATVLLTGMADDSEVMFSCVVKDDGTFTLPAATAAELSALGFGSGILTGVGRTVSRTVRSGSAVLTVRTFVMAMGEP